MKKLMIAVAVLFGGDQSLPIPGREYGREDPRCV